MNGSTTPQAAGGHGANADSPSVSPGVTADSGAAERLELSIAGMTCGHCVTAVRDALGSLPGVTIERVVIGKASVTLAPHGSSPAAVLDAIREAGYEAGFGATAGTDAKAGLPQAASGGSCCASAG